MLQFRISVFEELTEALIVLKGLAADQLGHKFCFRPAFVARSMQEALSVA